MGGDRQLDPDSYRDSSIKKHQQANSIGLFKNINKYMRLASARFTHFVRELPLVGG